MFTGGNKITDFSIFHNIITYVWINSIHAPEKNPPLVNAFQNNAFTITSIHMSIFNRRNRTCFITLEEIHVILYSIFIN